MHPRESRSLHLWIYVVCLRKFVCFDCQSVANDLQKNSSKLEPNDGDDEEELESLGIGNSRRSCVDMRGLLACSWAVNFGAMNDGNVDIFWRLDADWSWKPQANCRKSLIEIRKPSGRWKERLIYLLIYCRKHECDKTASNVNIWCITFKWWLCSVRKTGETNHGRISHAKVCTWREQHNHGPLQLVFLLLTRVLEVETLAWLYLISLQPTGLLVLSFVLNLIAAILFYWVFLQLELFVSSLCRCSCCWLQ